MEQQRVAREAVGEARRTAHLQAKLALQAPGATRLVVCDLSAARHLDLAAVGMLRKLHATVERPGARRSVTGAHGRVRDLLRRDGFAGLVGDIGRNSTLEAVLDDAAPP